MRNKKEMSLETMHKAYQILFAAIEYYNML